MTIKFTDDIFFGNTLFEGATFVFCEDSIFVNPEIIEADEDCVVIENGGEEILGKAVHAAFLTEEEALKISRRLNVFVNIDNKIFGWSQATKRRLPQFCYWFVKQRGTRFWGHRVNQEQALDLCAGRKELRYWTNSNKSELVIVK